jgi:hypothetical protein
MIDNDPYRGLSVLFQMLMKNSNEDFGVHLSQKPIIYPLFY